MYYDYNNMSKYRCDINNKNKFKNFLKIILFLCTNIHHKANSITIKITGCLITITIFKKKLEYLFVIMLEISISFYN